MRISDWSSDVCSSDLYAGPPCYRAYCLPVETQLSNLIDQHGRRKRKLRISLTDRCNFRCRYCMPEHPQWLPKRSEEHTPELQSLMRISYAVFCLKKTKKNRQQQSK